jgi:lactoylglutathione lyase
MKLAYTMVYVSDVAASLGFFERAFGLATRFLHESGGYGELETGATVLAFAQHDVARSNLGRDYVAAGASAQPLGMEPLAPPVIKPWGQTVAYLRCPDGTLVELCTAMD